MGVLFNGWTPKMAVTSHVAVFLEQGALGLLNECSGLSRLWPMRADERFVVRASAFGEAALGLLGHKTGEALKDGTCARNRGSHSILAASMPPCSYMVCFWWALTHPSLEPCDAQGV